ncbi:SDR family oxidoreductase [Virgibacillus sp. NKC19-16]|uniref:SDR family oxidoreductase n=1 Tax=Virgibacillus salidurans TaxID=2831673 RepID=UPI001F350AC8|nr:SDR family oxidoreductase [Virgibacillus sp. NKC19-16]UJL46266.1 SDR family oxidoreductase [Virgibacillus sp. NKC19-16]
MKVLVIGANGQIGKHIVNQLQNSNEHTVRAMVRKEEQAEALQQSGVEAVVTNLEGSVDGITEAAKGCDAVIFTAGSGASTGSDKTILIDLDGAVKSIEAAEQAGAKRFIMVSAIQTHKRENWSEKIAHYSAAKHYADRMLEASALNYTILRPGGLLNEPGTGKIAAADSLSRGDIPREDVARTAITALTEENAHTKAFDLISGDTDIAEALKKV